MIRTGCAVCAAPFVKGDYPHIVAWVDPAGDHVAAHTHCVDSIGPHHDGDREVPTGPDPLPDRWAP